MLSRNRISPLLIPLEKLAAKRYTIDPICGPRTLDIPTLSFAKRTNSEYDQQIECEGYHVTPNVNISVMKECCCCVRYAELITVSAPVAVTLGLLDPATRTRGLLFNELFPHSPIINAPPPSTVEGKLGRSTQLRSLPTLRNLGVDEHYERSASNCHNASTTSLRSLDNGETRQAKHQASPFAASDFVYDGDSQTCPAMRRELSGLEVIIESATARWNYRSIHNNHTTTCESPPILDYNLGLTLNDGSCECKCHALTLNFTLAEMLHQGFSSTVFVCANVRQADPYTLFTYTKQGRCHLGSDNQENLPSIDLGSILPMIKTKQRGGQNLGIDHMCSLANQWLGCMQAIGEVVVKLVHKSRCDPIELSNMQEETRHLTALSHPNIVRLIASYDGVNELWLFFERSDYRDLGASLALDNRGMKEEHARHIVRQILLALECCHQHRIVHGDVKPPNILVYERADAREPTVHQEAEESAAYASTRVFSGDWHGATVKLADFGLARSLPANQDLLRFQGVQGTQGYFAPEILLRRDYGCKVDVWALGIIAFQLIGGYDPFYPASKCISEPLRFNSVEWTRVSPACTEFISGLLQFSPDARLSASEALNHPWMTQHHSE